MKPILKGSNRTYDNPVEPFVDRLLKYIAAQRTIKVKIRDNDEKGTL